MLSNRRIGGNEWLLTISAINGLLEVDGTDFDRNVTLDDMGPQSAIIQWVPVIMNH